MSIEVDYIPQEVAYITLLDNGGVFKEADGKTIKLHYAPF